MARLGGERRWERGRQRRGAFAGGGDDRRRDGGAARRGGGESGRTRDLSCRRSRRRSCRRVGRAWSWRSSRARRGMMARRRPPRTRNSNGDGRSVQPSGRAPADGKGDFFFAESAPLRRGTSWDPEEARATRALRRVRVAHPGDATAGRPRPAKTFSRTKSTPDLSPDPKNFARRDTSSHRRRACPSARVRPACPRRSALRSSPTSARLRALPPAISSEPCSGSRPRTPTPPWCPTRRSAPSRSWGARRTPRISSATSTRRTDAPRPWTSPARRRTTPQSQHPHRANLHPSNDSIVRILRWGVRRQSERVGVAAGGSTLGSSYPPVGGKRTTRQVRGRT